MTSKDIGQSFYWGNYLVKADMLLFYNSPVNGMCGEDKYVLCFMFHVGKI